MAAPLPFSLALGRFKRLGSRSDETWQGGLVKMPLWIEGDADDPAATPSRPTGAFWWSSRTGLVHMDIADAGKATPEFALATLLDFPARVKGIDSRPARIEVRDPSVRGYLALALDGLDTAVVVVDRLPGVEEALRYFEVSANGGRRLPGMLEGPGVTLEHVKAIADAAAAFFNAKPWRHLTNEDLLVVDSPTRRVPKRLKHFTVLGHGHQEFGLAFFDSRKAFERLLDAPDPTTADRAHGLTFGTIDELPFADVDLWEDHDLPVARRHAYPLAAEMHRDGTMRRPAAPDLVVMESLLRARRHDRKRPGRGLLDTRSADFRRSADAHPDAALRARGRERTRAHALVARRHAAHGRACPRAVDAVDGGPGIRVARRGQRGNRWCG